MGNHDVGRAFASAAEVFWLALPGPVTKDIAMKALDAVGNRYRGADAEFDDEIMDATTPLGKMVAIAFDATPEELATDEDEDLNCPWYDGPCTRFRNRYEFC